VVKAGSPEVDPLVEDGDSTTHILFYRQLWYIEKLLMYLTYGLS